MAKGSEPRPPDGPSTTHNPSGKGRGNWPSKKENQPSGKGRDNNPPKK